MNKSTSIYRMLNGLVWGVYYQHFMPHTKTSRVMLLNDWLNDPEYYNQRFDSIEESYSTVRAMMIMLPLV